MSENLVETVCNKAGIPVLERISILRYLVRVEGEPDWFIEVQVFPHEGKICIPPNSRKELLGAVHAVFQDVNEEGPMVHATVHGLAVQRRGLASFYEGLWRTQGPRDAQAFFLYLSDDPVAQGFVRFEGLVA